LADDDDVEVELSCFVVEVEEDFSCLFEEEEDFSWPHVGAVTIARDIRPAARDRHVVRG